MELLSPAGSFESLKAAVQSGADAVYLGVGNFHARQFSSGFDNIKEAFDYAHLRNCKIHVTMNTLLPDRDFDEWISNAKEAINLGADAIIVQDLGAFSALSQIYPNIPLHVSTQAAIHNSAGAVAMKNLGASRVVLARELTKNQISNIHKNCDIELEVFAHGALCVCYSGRCLMSSFIGARSANKGMCAQPCRLPYTINGKTNYALSAKDLCLVSELENMRRAGVSCIKIEGRMKRPQYVAAVTSVYRKALDGHKITQEDRETLLLAFNRGEFTKGLFSEDAHRIYSVQPGNLGVNLGEVISKTKNTVRVATKRTVNAGDEIVPMSPDAPTQKVKSVRKIANGFELEVPFPAVFDSDVRLIRDSENFSKFSAFAGANNKKNLLSAHFFLKGGLPATLSVYSKDGLFAEVCGETPEVAQKRSLSDEIVFKQLGKTGDVPFYFDEITTDLQEGYTCPAGAINELRRRAIAEISELILHRDTPEFLPYTKPTYKKTAKKPAKLSVTCKTKQQFDAVSNYVDIAYVPMDFQGTLGCELVGKYPDILSDAEYDALKKYEVNFDTISTSTHILTEKNKIADFDFNVMNSQTASVLSNLGYRRVCLSRELNNAQISALNITCETEVVVYGHTVLMTTEHCPVDCDRRFCSVKANKTCMTDRKGKKFPLIHTGKDCRVLVLNSVPLFIADKLQKINADVYRLEFSIETPEECANIARLYRDSLEGKLVQNPLSEYTHGHFNRGL